MSQAATARISAFSRHLGHSQRALKAEYLADTFPQLPQLPCCSTVFVSGAAKVSVLLASKLGSCAPYTLHPTVSQRFPSALQLRFTKCQWKCVGRLQQCQGQQRLWAIYILYIYLFFFWLCDLYAIFAPRWIYVTFFLLSCITICRRPEKNP